MVSDAGRSWDTQQTRWRHAGQVSLSGVFPPNSTLPPPSDSNPASVRSTWVLPEPDAPVMPIRSPGRTVKDKAALARDTTRPSATKTNGSSSAGSAAVELGFGGRMSTSRVRTSSKSDTSCSSGYTVLLATPKDTITPLAASRSHGKGVASTLSSFGLSLYILSRLWGTSISSRVTSAARVWTVMQAVEAMRKRMRVW